MKYLLKEDWLDYHRKVIPSYAPEVQIKESRRAFYAGAYAMFSRLTSVLDEGAEPSEEDLKAVDSLLNEVKEFFKEVAEGLR